MQNGMATLEGSLEVSYQVIMFLLYDPAITLSIFPKEMKTYFQKKTVHMFIKVVFIIAKLGSKQNDTSRVGKLW